MFLATSVALELRTARSCITTNSSSVTACAEGKSTSTMLLMSLRFLAMRLSTMSLILLTRSSSRPMALCTVVRKLSMLTDVHVSVTSPGRSATSSVCTAGTSSLATTLYTLLVTAPYWRSVSIKLSATRLYLSSCISTMRARSGRSRPRRVRCLASWMSCTISWSRFTKTWPVVGSRMMSVACSPARAASTLLTQASYHTSSKATSVLATLLYVLITLRESRSPVSEG